MQHSADHVALRGQRRFTPMFRPVTFLTAFGVVLVAPRRGLCVIV